MQLRGRAFLLAVTLSLASVAVARATPPFELGDSGSSPDAPRAPHPEPRVIVNVLSVRGPHKPDRVQHDARFGWSRIVRCYKKTNGAKEKVMLTLELAIAGEGSVTGARSILFEPKDRALALCLAEVLTGLPMPKAPSSSTADVEFVLSPGDRPAKS